MSFSELSIMNLVPALRPDWGRPEHLAEYCGVLERIPDGHIRVCVSVPAQHYKSSTTLVAVVWLLLRYPTLRILIITHTFDKATAMSIILRELCELAGIEMKKGFNTRSDWSTKDGGGCVCMSIEQSRLGYPCDVLIGDDLHNEDTCEDASLLDEVDRKMGLYISRCATHLDSVVVCASRWKRNDFVGRCEERGNWEIFNWPGIIGFTEPPPGVDLLEHLEATGARAFAPDVLPLALHIKTRKEQEQVDPSLRSWWAQTQNSPLGEATGFFEGETPFLGGMPRIVLPVYGVDFAYSQGKRADRSALIGTIMMGDTLVVFDRISHRLATTENVASCNRVKDQYPDVRFASYVSGPEKGVYDQLWELAGIEVETMPARWSKPIRSQKTAFNWRRHKVAYVRGAWNGPFLRVMHGFSGAENGDDDDVDALVSAHDASMLGMGSGGVDVFHHGRPVM